MAIFFILTLVISILLIPPSNSVFFNIPSFDSNTNNMFYEGDATFNNGSLELTRIDYLCRVGRAMYNNQIQMCDPSTSKPSDFTTTFSFTVDTLNGTSYGDGFSFFLAPAGSHIPFNSAGGFQGLYNTTTLEYFSENRIVAVEFDTHVNFEWDPPYEHVGINVNSLSSATHVRWNFSAHSGEIGRVDITYNSTTKGLNVVVSYEGMIHNQTHELNYVIDMMKILPQWVVVGFSAATGLVDERHVIHAWEFNSTFDVRPITVTERSHNHVNIWLVISSFSMGFLLFLFISWSAVWIRKRARPINENGETVMLNHLSSMNGILDRGAWPRKFSHQELLKATNNFSDEKKLGQGGFGSVYKGVLEELNNMEIAVKRFSNRSKQGKKEYLTEVLIISSLRHRNLVRLIGWCHDQGDFMLVYELMPNGSLDSHLFNNRSTSLTWYVRYKIALGLASALLYLHEEWEQCVIHRDIKSSNVMLDSGFNAKLGDFGLARIMGHEVSLQTTALAGTWGYLAPEYISKGKASKESDVYSFGIVALEIACGRRTVEHDVEESRVSLVEWVWCLYGQGKILDAADERLGRVFDLKQMERLLVVGLWCAHPDHNLRPGVKEAIQVLNFEANLPQLPMAMPVLVYGAPLQRLDHSGHGSITLTSVENGR